DDIAGAVIMDGGNLAQDAAFAVLRFQADQIGVIEFFFVRLGQQIAGDEKFGAFQRLGGSGGGDTGKGQHRLALFAGAKSGDGKSLAVPVLQRAVSSQRLGRSGEDFRLHRAFETGRADHSSEEDIFFDARLRSRASTITTPGLPPPWPPPRRAPAPFSWAATF